MHAPTLTRQVATLVFSMALIAGAQCAFAAPVFRVIGDGHGVFRFDESSSSFVSRGDGLDLGRTDPITGHVLDFVVHGFAAAGPGGLRADANSKLFTNFESSGAVAGASVVASMTLDDVMVSGPAGTLTTAYKFHLSGTLEAGTNSGTPDLVGARADLSVVLFGNGGVLNANSFALKDSGLPQRGFGLLQNFTGSNDLISDPFTVTANQAFPVTLQLGVGAESRTVLGASGLAIAAAHFSNTLTFVTDGPVFDLPAGYTANSISGNIVNNRFVPASVPLPAAIWLLGSAVGGLGLMRRRGV